MLAPIQNLHSHTKYCDGGATPEEMVKKAIELGYGVLGFSSHSYQYFSPKYTMLEEPALQYKEEIAALKEKYKDQLRIYCGLECDMYSTCVTEGYDYLIGSSHFMRVGEDIFEFDKNEEIFAELLEKYFHGDMMAFLKKYYEDFADLKKHGDYDIVGHFDLVTRHCDTHPFFDENTKEYRDMALACAHALAKDFDIFEINSGTLSYNERKQPYPAPYIIKELKTLGASIVLSSDAHNVWAMENWRYKETVELVKACGYDEVMILTDEGFTGMKL